MQGWAPFFVVFGVIFVAELPDKTALAALVLATRHRPFPVLLGAATALTIQSLVAVTAGQLFSLLPHRPVQIAASLLFIISAVLMWRRNDDDESVDDDPSKTGFWASAWLVFVVVFVAEWGDLTQLATAELAAVYRSPFTVFAGATAALWLVAALAVFIGHRAGKLLDPTMTKRVAAGLFAAVGAVLLARAV
jgi:putative Ca2+/H+ antiporter (TMEM165/GDT1 family)